MDGSSREFFFNGSKPLGIAVDFVSERLYWTDSAGRVWESTMDSSVIKTIYSDSIFLPFQVATVKKFVLVTSQVNNSYVLIDREDLSVAHVETAFSTLYYGVSVVSILKKPSLGELSYLVYPTASIFFLIRHIFLHARRQ